MRSFPSPGRVGLAVLLIGLLTVGPPGSGGRAAEIVPYEVTINATGIAAVDEVVRETSSLISLRDTAQIGPFALLLRARDDVERMRAALNAQGYYDNQVRMTVDGLTLDDPALLGVLDALPDGRKAAVVAVLEPGPTFTLGRITVNGGPPPTSLGLVPGAPARAADVLAARDRLLASMLADGYALAKVAPPIATLRADARALDVAFDLQTGPRVALGEVGFTGLAHVDEAFARERLGLRPGERFDPARLRQAQRDLMAAGTFASVVIGHGTTVDADGRLPLAVRVTERKLRVVNIGAAFSTDQGGSLTAAWTHRNLFGAAEQLALSAAVTQLGGTANKAPGYNLGAALTVPDWRQRAQTLVVRMNAVNEYLRAYDRIGVTAGALVSRPLWPGWTANLGPSVTQEQIVQEGVGRDYSVIQMTAGLRYDDADDLLDPRRGFRGAVTLTPTVSFGGRAQSSFLIGQGSLAGYHDLSGDGRTVLAGRVLVGAILGAGAFDVPPDQRFYGGGGGTIRGFRYQSIGPQFPSNRPAGGTAVDAGSVELRQRFGEDWGAAAFIDAGQVSARGMPFTGPVQVGAGVGVRYYTSIGPVRLDLAVPVTRQRKGDAFELYIGLGHAF